MIMTQTHNLKTQPVHPVSLSKIMLLGAGIALMLIAIFLSGAGEPNPEWGKFWMIRPLIVVPAAGAAGGLFYYLMDHLRYQGGWKKVLGTVLSVLVYLFGLWIGTILGLAGTLWN
jgi:hypothetical protein